MEWREGSQIAESERTGKQRNREETSGSRRQKNRKAMEWREGSQAVESEKQRYKF